MAQDSIKPSAEATTPKKKDASKKKETAHHEEELSEEDQQLKTHLDLLVERLLGSQEDLYAPALESMKKFIRESTSSMTAVPKPLKFLRPHYPALVALAEKWSNQEDLRKGLSDILSILGMTYSGKDGEQYKRESLKWRLQSNVGAPIGEWGHEYLRHLSLEIGEAYQEALENAGTPKEEGNQSAVPENSEELIELSMIIVEYFIKHNAETEAVDLLLEIEQIEKLPQHVDKDTYERVCNYMVACVPLLAPPDDLAFLNTAYTIYLSNNQLPQALTIAIRLDDYSLVRAVFNATDDTLVHKQLGFMLGRQNSSFKVEDEEVQECINNVKLSEYYKYLVGELNLLQPKVPEDVYKSHLETSIFASTSRLESAKQNLAAAFVNGFLNAGYGTEKLIGDERWIYRTKGEGMLSTTASLGMVNLWDTNEGLQVMDKYLYSEQPEVKAGALLGMGIATASVHDDVEPALLILQDYVSADSKQDARLTTAAITGLGIAFAGSENEEVLNLLSPLVSEPSVSLEIQSLAALALGHVFVGTCNGDITSTILQALLEKDPAELTSKWIRYMSLGLGLLYMGKYDQVDDVLETIDAIEHPIVRALKVLVTICSYAGTGNVLQIQQLLQMCIVKQKDDEDDEEDDDEKDEEKDEDDLDGTADVNVEDGLGDLNTNNSNSNSNSNTESTESVEVKDESKIDTEDSKSKVESEEEDSEFKSSDEDDTYQGYCVLGLALIAMGEEIGQEMSLRHFDHLMHYGTPLIRRAVPLAMGLVSASNPEMSVYDTLSRYSHDQDLDVACNAIFAMGLVGAGTNNARLAQLLRQLASYYINDQNGLFITRISQGLVHLGKGTLTLSPFTVDRQTLSKVGLASLLTIAISLMEPTSFILDQNSSLLYYITSAIKPRMLVTVDTELKPVKVNVRVGQAVDVVGQAGKPKTITGWVTHSTPVLLGYGERAELETDEHLPIASSLEGVVVLKKNPDYMDLDA
ncbi:DEKNAAC104748 [Brettanomyces naardenensis]|uniref:26S proteasome regulatory subunit RPN1 n=1 Tax=Brettanomyces naardenensis TaxID=13370 RepID=A0A448YRH3_BRENA|nr:DEKNAAC104748 [Brettanomyces naardenensis]